MRSLYPPIEPFNSGMLKVSDLHEIYFEEAGNPQGKPIVFLHGGPGGGIDAAYRQYFDPKKYRIVLFDQRGCGKSKPHSELKDNTTWDLVADIEKIREHLKIKKWVVFGGSWGSTLSLAYAQTHPDRCVGLILRGIFLLRQREIDWFYQEGASWIYPDAWEGYVKPIPESERGDLVKAYHKRLTSPDKAVREEASKAWSVWEASTSKLIQSPEAIKKYGGGTFADAFARIECHYFTNKGFMREDGQLLKDAHKLKNIPTAIVHGRYDVICPLENAWLLKKAMPHAELHIIADAGHSVSEQGIASKLIEMTDKFAEY